MKITNVIKLSILAIFLSFSSTQAQGLDLVSSLTKQLGINKSQASSGAGSLFNLASDNLGSTKFQEIANVVPGISNMMKDGNISLGGGSGMSSLSSMAGALSGMSKVNAIFKKLGLSPQMVQKFIPIILKYVNGKGGSSVSNLLAGALK